MSLLQAVRHYTCGISFNQIERVIARWEEYTRFTEWGYHWRGGWLIELYTGKFIHLRAWRNSAEPWEYEGRVNIDYLEDPTPPTGYNWTPYPLKKTHIKRDNKWVQLS